MTNQLESNIMIDKNMMDQLKGNIQDYLTCEAKFHRLAKIDHLVDTYRVSPMVTAASGPQDCAKSGEGINTSKDFLIAAVVSEPQDCAKSGEGINTSKDFLIAAVVLLYQSHRIVLRAGKV